MDGRGHGLGHVVAGEAAELLRRREVLIPKKLKFITRKSNLHKPEAGTYFLTNSGMLYLYL
jgi:hypothetical protein